VTRSFYEDHILNAGEDGWRPAKPRFSRDKGTTTHSLLILPS